ncbi:MAG: PKD domain-containing protein [Patescibacteria group bacterium]|nr:PKD domain-containing protein [Patescibacteria group bacterium]
MPDLKKLITGFLIIAAAAASSAWILSGNQGQGAGNRTQNNNLPAANGNNQAAQTNTPTGNAFAPANTATPSAQAVAAETLSSTTAAQMNDPNNMTGNLADLFLNNMVAQNADGNQQTDANGNPIFNQPDTTAVIQELAQTNAAANFQVPNWDAEAAGEKINIINNYSKNDINNYAASVGAIFNQLQSSTILDTLKTEDPKSAVIVEATLYSTLHDVAAVPTPAPLANFQKSLVKLLVYEKNYAGLIVTISTDPVRTALLVQGEEPKFKTAMQELQNQAKALASLSLNDVPAQSSGLTSLLNQVLGIQTAYANIPVIDPAHIASTVAGFAATVGQFALQYARDIALQITKNYLMALLQQRVLNWIQGSGAPRFVTNWASTIVNSYASAAQAALDSQFACVPSFMLPSLQILLSTPAIVGSNNACQAQFNSQLENNLQNFYNNFAAGGFDSYFQIFQTNGNAFGAIINIQDAVTTAGANAQQATLAQKTASQGYNDSQYCAPPAGADPSYNTAIYPDGKYLPDGIHYMCKDNEFADVLSLPKVGPGGSVACQNYQSLVTVPNGNRCADGSTPQTTQPGNVANQAFGSALDSSSRLIAAGNDVVGLAEAFVQSLLNTLAGEAIGYANQAMQGGGGGRGVPDSGIVGTPSNIGQSVINQSTDYLTANSNPVTCYADNPSPAIDESTMQPATVNFSASGGALDTSGYPPTYTWSTSNGDSGAGDNFSETYTAPGTYTATVTASTGGQAICTVTVTTYTPEVACDPSAPNSCSNGQTCQLNQLTGNYTCQ